MTNRYKTPSQFIYSLIALLILVSCNNDDNTSVPEEKFSGELEWIKVLGGSNEDNILSVDETIDGGYIVAGYTLSTDGDIVGKTTTDSDYWVMKLTENGAVTWNKVYGGTADDRAEEIIQTTDGGYMVVGYSRSADKDVSANEGLQDYWVVKISSTGDIQWEKNFGFAGIDRAHAVIQTTDGGYFITGFLDVSSSDGEGNDKKSNSTKHGVGEFWGIKLDAEGNKQWRHYFGGTNNDRSYDVIQTEDGGFLMIGSSESIDFDITNNKGVYDFWAVKVNAAGVKLWQKSYGGSQIDVGYSIAATGKGTYIIIGDSRSEDIDITKAKGNADLWMIQIDGTGNLLWQKSIGGTQFDTGRSIRKTQNENFIITGNSRSNDVDVDKNRGQSDLWNLIIDTDGNVKWNSTLGGSGEERGEDCLQTVDKKIVIVGSSESSDFDVPSNKGSKDAIIVKYK